MKRTIYIFLILCILLSCISFPAAADTEYVSNGVSYTISGNSAYVSGYSGTATTLVIPATVKGYPVIGIGHKAFAYCNFTSAILGSNITDISSYAFSHCSKLVSIKLPAKLSSIGAYAFYGCSKLSEIEIPDSVTTIDYNAFTRCTSLTMVTIGKGVTSMSANAFGSCPKLTSFSVSEENTTFSSDHSGKLYNKDKTRLIQAPAGISGIVLIPDSVTCIGSAAFYECMQITDVAIPDSVTTIEDYAFADCRALFSITIPKSVTVIGESAFYDCKELSEIHFKGDAPELAYDIFTNVTANAYYPEGNSTWTEEERQSYGGDITWIGFRESTTGDLDGVEGVDNRDVEYLLWHTLFPEDYPLTKNADFTGDGCVDNQDVEYLLWHTLFPDEYPL